MDALRSLVTRIPDWLKRLDDLSGQIDLRQAELAHLNSEKPPSADARPLRNKGSSESLKPKDDGPLHADLDLKPLSDSAQLPVLRQPSLTSPESANRLALHNKAREAVDAARLRAAVQTRKRITPSSIISAEAAPPAYQMRSMIIVYYDSYVQGFFDELVRFTSFSRNSLRKARMAARVAHFKRLAEREMQDNDAGATGNEMALDSLPSLRYMSTRRSGVMSTAQRSDLVGPGDSEPQDIFERLDKSLEFVQSTCEHGAHQFLREADCGDEIKKIQARLAEVLEAAEKETDRLQSQDLAPAKEFPEPERLRARRSVSIGKEMVVGTNGDAEPDDDATPAFEVSRTDHGKTNVIEAFSPLEVDTGEDADEGIDKMLPKLQYRSTRYLRTRAN